MINSSTSRLTPKATAFLNEWRNSNNHIKAHTSGSTGAPKEISLAKADMEVSAQATNKFFEIGSKSTLFLPLSPDYIAGKMMLVRAEIAQCTIIVKQPTNNIEPLVGQSIDLMSVVPSQCSYLVENPQRWKGLKNLIIGGAPLMWELEQQLLDMPWNGYATYGMTETCSHVALRRIGQKIYKALPGIEFSVDNRNCLVINAENYSFKRLVTNDIVDLLSPSEFYWLGRADNIINSGGMKLYPEQIESELAKHITLPVMIRKIADSKWGEAPEIVIETPYITSGIVNKIREICQQYLPKATHHAKITCMNKLPRTENGKLRRI